MKKYLPAVMLVGLVASFPDGQLMWVKSHR